MTQEIDSQSLLIRLQELKLNYPEDNQKYLHTKSIENFLVYFDKIKPHSKQRFVYENISNFLTEAENETINSVGDCQILYSQYILKVGQLYSLKLSFSYAGTYKLIGIIFSIPIIGIFILKLSPLFYLADLILFLTIIIFQNRSEKKKKTWGFLY